MKVSIITPTYNRELYLKKAYASLKHQTWSDKEWLILDDSAEPSDFFLTLKDPSVRYIHATQRMTIGDKRNQLLQQATGEVIVHFDDDDYYSPHYIERMIARLGDNDFITLESWFAYAEKEQIFYFWETGQCDSIHFMIDPRIGSKVGPGDDLRAALHDFLWGYGFSYVYRRHVSSTVQFDPRKNWGEDLDFLMRLRNQGYRIGRFPDHEGMVLHIMHVNNNARIFPQYRLPEFLIKTIFEEFVTTYLTSSREVLAATSDESPKMEQQASPDKAAGFRS